MQLFLSALVLAGLATAKTPHAAKYNKIVNERRAATYQQQSEARQALLKRDVTYQHLNNATQPYLVNATALPNVTPEVAAYLPESYAGLLPLGKNSSNELFFWYVPSTNPSASDEITIWLNGGPGCSSLDGFWHENGPIIWSPGAYAPTYNTYSWTNLTNVVWIEQPIGTGYSQGTPTAKDEVDVANQFADFWPNFVDLFGLHDRKVYVTGESYAGQYVPYIAAGMLEKNDTKYFNVSGIMVYDPSIGSDAITEQAPAVRFVDKHKDYFPFNSSFVEKIHNVSATCGYDSFMEKALTFPPAGPLPPAPGLNARGRTSAACDVFDMIFEAIFSLNPVFDIYNIAQNGQLLWDTLGFPYSDFYLPVGYDQPYFNQSVVKDILHVPQNSNWQICTDVDVFPTGDASKPSGLTGGPLAYVTDRVGNTIVGHGSVDMVLLAEGSLATLQNLTWGGKQGFSEPPNKPFYVPYHDDSNMASLAGAGVFGGWVSERGLTFVTIELAGHMVPEYTPSAGYRHLEKLLGRIASLDEVSAFTTQPGYPQPGDALGNSTTPLRKPVGLGRSRVGSRVGTVAGMKRSIRV